MPKQPLDMTLMHVMLTAKLSSTKIGKLPPLNKQNSLVNLKLLLTTTILRNVMMHAKPFSKPTSSNGKRKSTKHAQMMLRVFPAEKPTKFIRIPLQLKEMLTTQVKHQTEKHSMPVELKLLKHLSQLSLLLGSQITLQLPVLREENVLPKVTHAPIQRKWTLKETQLNFAAVP